MSADLPAPASPLRKTTLPRPLAACASSSPRNSSTHSRSSSTIGHACLLAPVWKILGTGLLKMSYVLTVSLISTKSSFRNKHSVLRELRTRPGMDPGAWCWQTEDFGLAGWGGFLEDEAGLDVFEED